MADTAHQQRVKKELAATGMTAYGQHKLSSRYLPKIIGKDEHIKGVVYGHRSGGLATLIATDKRVIYLEKRPLFTSTDDISYEVIAGVKYMDAGIFPSVTLHTRLGDYTLTYVNVKCAHLFVEYIEKRISRQGTDTEPESAEEESLPKIPATALTEDSRKFLQSHDVGVLSSSDRTGHVQGATIYYILGSDDIIYFLTKSETAKAQNMMAHSQVAFTVYDSGELQTAQIHGFTEVEADIETKRHIFEELVKPRDYNGVVMMPPVTQLDRGGFMAFRLTPTFVKYIDFKQTNRIVPSRPKSG